MPGCAQASPTRFSSRVPFISLNTEMSSRSSEATSCPPPARRPSPRHVCVHARHSWFHPDACRAHVHVTAARPVCNSFSSRLRPESSDPVPSEHQPLRRQHGLLFFHFPPSPATRPPSAHEQEHAHRRIRATPGLGVIYTGDREVVCSPLCEKRRFSSACSVSGSAPDSVKTKTSQNNPQLGPRSGSAVMTLSHSLGQVAEPSGVLSTM